MEVAQVRGGSPASRLTKNQALDERFTTRIWTKPLPLEQRKSDFPHCAKCFASFMLDNDAAIRAAREMQPAVVNGVAGFGV